MLKLTLKSIRGHLGRFLLTLFAVTLGIAFVAGSYVLTDSMKATFDDLVTASSEGVDVVVRPDQDVNVTEGGPSPRLPVTLVESLRGVDGVVRAVPDYQGLLVLAGKDGSAVRTGGAPSFGLAYRPDDPAVRLAAGRAPQGPDEVAVEVGALERSGLSVGDTTSALVGSAPRQVRITGTVTFEGPMAGASLTVLDEATARAAFSPDGAVQQFSVTAGDGTSPAAVRDRITAVLPAGVEAVTSAEAGEEMRKEINEALGFVNTFLLVFAGISLFVGSFIIFNTFSMLVAQRTRELALLRAVGASRRQVVGAVLGEALVVGLVGAGVGILTGIGLAGGLQQVLQQFGFEATSGLPLRLRTVIISLVVGALVTTVSAALPAVRASRAAPIVGLRDDVIVTPKGVRLRGAVGLVAVLLGVAGLLAGLRGDVTWAVVGVGAVVVVLGVLVAAPLLTRPVVRVVCAPFVVLTGTVGRLARENSLRNARRTAATATALTIGLAVMAGLSVLVSSAKASISDLVASEVSADFVLETGGMVVMPETATRQVAAIDGVDSVAALSWVEVDLGAEQVGAQAVGARELAATMRMEMRSGSLQALDAGRILVNESTAKENGWAVGSVLHAGVGTAEDRTLTVGGVFADMEMLSRMLIPQDLYEEGVALPDRGSVMLLVTAKDGADVPELRSALGAAAKPFIVVSVQTGEEFVDAQAAELDQFLAIMYVLLALSIVIAVLGIINTLALSILERTREIGLLRAVGLARGQLFRMITIESVATALFGAVLGALLGLGLGIAAQRGLVQDGLEVLAISWGQLGIVMVGAGVAGVIAAVLPAVRATRLNVLQAISTD